jgi:hypothetical protein
MTTATYTESNPLSLGDQAIYLVEGTLTELQTARTTVNLLEQIDRNVKSKSIVTGFAAALSGMHGIVANAASLALYDGEETSHFAGLLDGQVICGTFQHAENIKDGDRVKVVVSKKGDVLFTHAILNVRTQEFYMPMNVFSSDDGLFSHCMTVARNLTVVGWVLMLGGFALVGVFSDPEMSVSTKLVFVLMSLVVPPLIMFPSEYWMYRTMGGGDKSDDVDSYGGAIFKVFGFPQPDKIDLMRHSDLSTGANGGWYAAWRVDKLRAKLGA